MKKPFSFLILCQYDKQIFEAKSFSCLYLCFENELANVEYLYYIYNKWMIKDSERATSMQRFIYVFII